MKLSKWDVALWWAVGLCALFLSTVSVVCGLYLLGAAL